MCEKNRIRILPLIAALAIPLCAGAFSAFLTAKDMKIYETMAKPPLAPPGWVFPIVWTVLYGMMGLASYLIFVSEADPLRKRQVLTLYAVQLAMNLFWSTLFFTYSRYLIALIWLLIMWLVILFCAVRFRRIRRAAGNMMWILFLWTTFAAYLNLAAYLIRTGAMPGRN